MKFAIYAILTPSKTVIKEYPAPECRAPCISPIIRLSRSLEVIWPALLLGPELLVVSLRMDLELLQVGVDDLLTTVGALRRLGPVRVGQGR